MSAPHPVPKRTTTSFSARRRVNEKIVRFSLSMGTFAVALTALAYLASFYPEIQRLQGVNQRALSQINCRDSSCDTTEYSTNQDTPPDYVIDIKSRYLIETPPSSTEKPPHFRWLDLSDLTFVRKFREPASYQTIDLEIWRLYSRQAIFKGRTVEIMVGYAEKAASKMIDTPTSLTPVVDSKLRDEADKVAHGLQRNAKIGSASKLSADGLEIVDATTGRVMYWGPWLPGFLSDGARFPAPGTSFHISEAEVYIVQTDINDRILATSLVRIGNLWWL